ncbi:hypothetical protein, partial [Bradyrhizobium sp. NBAIM08]|uniref:hypothetical protein n=1 Tax=Bradyrhizobium sp. NBAIM08 TaxID=2793815 RepID=UPI001CD25A75
MSEARRWGAVAAAIAVAAGLTALGALLVTPQGDAASGAAPATVPTDDATVVATLQTSGAPRSAELVAALR